MLNRSREKIRQLKVLINWKHTKATQSSLGTKRAGMMQLDPFNFLSKATTIFGFRNTRPLNDLLPPEILIQIFETLILDVWASYKITPVLSRVCRSWHSVALELQLCKALITGSKAMEAILDYIHTTNRYKEDGTAGIRDLTVHTDHRKDFHRLPELLDLCRSSLQVLSLDRLLYKGEDLCPLLEDKQETGGKFYLPALKALSLTRLRSTELAFLLTSVDPARLRSLQLCDTPFPSEDQTHVDISSLRFPHLQEITVQLSWEEPDPGLPNLCQLAPTLETLKVSIARKGLQNFIDFLASDHAPNSLKMLNVSVEHGYFEDITRQSPIIKTLVDLIKKRGWKGWIHVPYDHMPDLLEW